MSTLSQFLLPPEIPLTKTKLGISPRDFVPDLALQGIVTEKKFREDLVLKSTSPTTIVNLHTHTIKQTLPYNEYIVTRKEFQEAHSRRIAKVDVSSTTRDLNELYRPVLASELIDSLVTKVFQLPTEPSYLREGFVSQSINLLVRKAIILIKYVVATKEELKKSSQVASPNSRRISTVGDDRRGDVSGKYEDFSERNGNGSDNNISTPEVTDGKSAPFNSNDFLFFKKSVMRGLGISEVDFSVLLGITEKIVPGSYVNMTDNPAWIEKKLIELFEQF
eukprot:TRINITY_DN3587_c0_g1_i3.p1 TRINITY_DN3587_c0_g1~~TRINITY_DN3587_c0_g1_i3.p1  ORF type:complete len:277 (+),score=27.73 TRINITY_DN3587_c0_g1_i3:47-877(+)